MLIIVGDFNVDFDRQGPLVPLLLEFMSENCLVASDLSYRSYVGFTYERDDGSCRSWIDHILCSTRCSSLFKLLSLAPFFQIICLFHFYCTWIVFYCLLQIILIRFFSATLIGVMLPLITLKVFKTVFFRHPLHSIHVLRTVFLLIALIT